MKFRLYFFNKSQGKKPVSAFGIPETIQHDDFHDGNILVQNATQEPSYIFFDWGDGQQAYPHHETRRTGQVSKDSRLFRGSRDEKRGSGEIHFRWRPHHTGEGAY